MPARPTIEQIRERVQRAFEPVLEVRAALVFGSYARRRARPDSDIDVAVLLDPSARAGDRGELLRKLLAALGRELRSDRIDLVVLDDAPPALAFQALRHGVVALDRDRVTLHRFRVRTYALHSDYEPIERLFRRATKRRAMGQPQRVGNGRR